MLRVYKPWIIAGFLLALSVPGTTAAQSPLNEFLARVENSGANMLVNTQSTREGSTSEWMRFNGDCSIHSHSTAMEGTELRWILNPDYVALIEKTEEGKWSLKGFSQPETEIYTKTKNARNTTSFLFGSLRRRIESLDPNYTMRESEDSVYEYQLLHSHPTWSVGSFWNSMTFRFDRNSKESRVQEIKFYESSDVLGNETVFEWIMSFEYPSDELFPVEIALKGSIILGSVPGVRDEDLWKKSRIEIEKDAKFESAECYLTFYCLPEPELDHNGSANEGNGSLP